MSLVKMCESIFEKVQNMESEMKEGKDLNTYTLTLGGRKRSKYFFLSA